MKLTILTLILTNVLATPWGLAATAGWQAIGLAILVVMLKVTVVGLVIVSIEAGFAKLRLLRNVDFLLAAVVLAALGGLAANL